MVYAIYEPPQECTDSSFTLLEDPQQERVDALAALMGLKRVGWVVAHPPREQGFVLSGNEVLTAAELQLADAQGVEDTPFVTLTATLNAQNGVETVPYQVSKQCMKMVAEGALELSHNPGKLRVTPSFTAIQEGSPTQEVENNFFLCNVAIRQHETDKLVNMFPAANRTDDPQTRTAMRQQLSKASAGKGWTLESLLCDFHLLLFLCDFFPVHEDMPIMVTSMMGNGFAVPEPVAVQPQGGMTGRSRLASGAFAGSVGAGGGAGAGATAGARRPVHVDVPGRLPEGFKVILDQLAAT